MIIRPYLPQDCPVLAALFYQTVHSVNARDYTVEQRSAWATGTVDLARWQRSLSENFSLVAEQDSVITGFGDIDSTGYLDRLFVHKDFQRMGIATLLCNQLEHDFFGREITTHASITARPFFEARGYRVVSPQQVERRGVLLPNFIMKKRVGEHFSPDQSPDRLHP